MRKRIANLDRYATIMESLTAESIKAQHDQLKSKSSKLGSTERRDEWAASNSKQCANKNHSQVTAMFKKDVGLSKIERDPKFAKDILKELAELK